jgi:hypothetical protein
MRTTFIFADDFDFTRRRSAGGGTVLDWIRRRLAARRARIRAARELAYLRSLDPHILDDIGVVPAALSDASGRLARRGISYLALPVMMNVR